MSTLIFTHVVTGLAGIVSGLIAIAGIFYRQPMDRWNAVFLSTTAAACATGFVFIPTDGVTSAQLVAFFMIFLLAVAAYARYVRHLDGSWNQVYALATVGIVFLNLLIATAQSFVHIQVLGEWAPTQQSPIYLVVKFSLLLMFVVVAIFAARRAGRS